MLEPRSAYGYYGVAGGYTGETPPDVVKDVVKDIDPEMKEECIERMKMLHLNDVLINDFTSNGTIYLSDGDAIVFLSHEQKRIIREWEKKYNTVAYHVIHSYTNFGELLSILYVSSYKEEWYFDREGIKENTPLCYVVNLDYEFCSEFGSIYVNPTKSGGLKRVL